MICLSSLLLSDTQTLSIGASLHSRQRRNGSGGEGGIIAIIVERAARERGEFEMVLADGLHLHCSRRTEDSATSTTSTTSNTIN